MIGLALLGLVKNEQVAGPRRPRIARNEPRAVPNQRPGINELGVLRRSAIARLEEPPAAPFGTRPAPYVGKRGGQRQPSETGPLGRMSTQRFSVRVSHQRRAVDHVVGLTIELGIGEKREPGAKRRAIRFIKELDLRVDRAGPNQK